MLMVFSATYRRLSEAAMEVILSEKFIFFIENWSQNFDSGAWTDIFCTLKKVFFGQKSLFLKKPPTDADHIWNLDCPNIIE